MVTTSTQTSVYKNIFIKALQLMKYMQTTTVKSMCCINQKKTLWLFLFTFASTVFFTMDMFHTCFSVF